MGRRIALVVSADSGATLTSGRRDATRVFSLLTDEDLGCCDPASPPPLFECKTRAQFHSVWDGLMSRWKHEDQLLFYFSGHGVMRHGKYTLALGAAPTQEYLPFDHLATDLQAHGVRRAVLILDACHSGAVVTHGAKDGGHEAPRLEQPLPSGLVVLTSCRESERSFEFEDGEGSVFTHLLARGIRSGLGGKPTPDNLIGPDDLMEYINTQLGDAKYAQYPQTATYQISSADRTVWIARNKAAPPAKEASASAARVPARSLDELQILYERTERSRHPCPGSLIDDLDWELVQEYAGAAKTPLEPGEVREVAARRLGLYSNLSETLLHNAAVLCFAKAPHRLLPQARAIFVRGDRSSAQVGRIDVLGSLSRQVQELTELVMGDVYRRLGLRPTERAAKLLAETVREAISNAITHRDYSRSELVRVAMNDDAIEVISPGTFPNGATFESLLSANHYSAPTDAAVAWYLTTLLAYEGVGRGFSVYKAFLKEAGTDAIRCEAQMNSLKLTIRIPGELALVAAPSAPAVGPNLWVATTMQGIGEGAAAPAPRIDTDSPRVARTGSGELVGGRYLLGPPLGAGSSGAVFLAEDTKLSRQVAIKILPKRFVTAEARERFLREATLAARIGHPGIVTVYDVSEESDRQFIVMELVSGFGLDTLIAGSDRGREFVPELFYFFSALLIRDVADALAAAHENLVIHRDIKPANIIVDESGRPRVLDFGVSRTAGGDNSTLTATGVLVGTPAYISPEQLGRDPFRVDARADIYSLGVVMYELLCHKLPYIAETLAELALKIVLGQFVAPREIMPSVPPELERICLKAMERDVALRYASAREMVLDLDAYLTANERNGGLRQDRSRFWSELRGLFL